jgi:hypothetical protein
MKNILLASFSCLLSLSLFAQAPSLVWSNPVTVTTGSQWGNSWPRIALTDNSVPVVMWGSTANKEIFVSRMNGGSFSTPVPIVPSSMDAFVGNWAGPDIGTSGDTVFVAFKQSPETTGGTYIRRSLDGGQTFSDTVSIGSFGTDVTRFPAIEVESGGNPIVAFMRFDSNFADPRYEVARSSDGGQTFDLAVEGSNSSPGEICDCCPTDIFSSGSTVLLPFRNNILNIRDTWMAISTNAALSFDTVIQMDNSNWGINGCPSQGPDVTLVGDTAVCVWMTESFGDGQAWISTLDMNTYVMSSSQQIASVTGQQQRPRIVSSNNTVGMVWEDQRSGDFDAYIAFSTTGPSGLLSNVENVIDATSGDQTNPDITFADGVFHIIWRDVNSNSVMYRTATVINPLSITQQNPIDALQVYPNPSTSNITVELPVDATQGTVVTLINSSGRVVLVEPVSQAKFKLETEVFAAGVYILEIATEQGLLRHKVILR